MIDWRHDIDAAVDAFVEVARLARVPLPRGAITVEYLPAPHRQPSRLPSERTAVYCFWYDGTWLKIGKAGPNSGPRYVSHHYNLSAPSTLAKSLAADAEMRDAPGFDPSDPGAWIRAQTCRVNILLPADLDSTVLALLEVFLHARLHPRYEG